MHLTAKKIAAFQEKILTWFDENARDLPWRRTADPYHILVSEIMLHQTQVDRVKNYFTRWFKQFPTMQDLAKAERATLYAMWSGLGYNNRVIRLQQAIQTVLSDFDGVFPDDFASLKKLPGIGTYTANAVLAFAYNQEAPVLDTNIKRVLIHEFKLPHDVSEKILLDLASQLIPVGKSRMRHNALMDYGSLVLTSKKT